MRIIGGKYRGKKLHFDPQLKTTRPTQDRHRESIFNVLNHHESFSWENKKVLDLYAGTGAFGLEALSHGAQVVHFVEQHPQALKTLKMNTTSFPNTPTKIFPCDVMQFIDYQNEKYDFIFMDPPYHENHYKDVIQQLMSKDLLSQDGHLLIEHTHDLPISDLGNLHLLREKKYGKIKFSLFRHTGTPSSS